MNYPDVFPSVSMDINLGNYTNYTDVDMNYITERLREGGLEDSEIAELTIHFSAIDNLNKKSSHITQGRYNHKKRGIEIARHDAKENFDLEENDIVSSIALSGIVYSDTVDHEIEHVVARKDQLLQKRKNAYIRRTIGRQLIRSSSVIFTGITSSGFALEYGANLENSYFISLITAIGVVAVKKAMFSKKIATIEFNEYLNNPEEIQARQAGESAPSTIVLFIQKHVPLNRRDGELYIDPSLLS